MLMARRRTGILLQRAGRVLVLALVASSGVGCSMHDGLVHGGLKKPAPLGSQMEMGRGQSSTMGVDMTKLKPGEKAPDPVPGSSLW